MDKKRARYLAAAVFAAALAFFPACALKKADTVVLGNPSSENKVLLAYEVSGFKAKVAQVAASELAAGGMAVTVADIARLKDQNPASFGAIVLLAPVVAWTINENVRHFVEKCPDKSRVILITTAGDTDYSAGVPGVDAVTEASVLEDADTLAHTIVGKVKALFNAE